MLERRCAACGLALSWQRGTRTRPSIVPGFLFLAEHHTAAPKPCLRPRSYGGTSNGSAQPRFGGNCCFSFRKEGCQQGSGSGGKQERKGGSFFSVNLRECSRWFGLDTSWQQQALSASQRRWRSPIVLLTVTSRMILSNFLPDQKRIFFSCYLSSENRMSCSFIERFQ